MFAENVAPDSFLVCRSAARLCALRLVDVVETMRPLPVVPIPAMPGFLLGASIIRGIVVPVINVGKLIGTTSDTVPKRYVTVMPGERQVAFAFDEVIGVRILSMQSVADIPLILHQIDPASVATITTLDAELLLVLQGTRLIPEAIWDTLSTEAAKT